MFLVFYVSFRAANFLLIVTCISMNSIHMCIVYVTVYLTKDCVSQLTYLSNLYSIL